MTQAPYTVPERFAAGAGTSRDGDIVGAYARLVEDPDPAVREKATVDWCTWEDALVSGEDKGQSGVYITMPPLDRLALIRICAHYFSHGAFLEDGALIRDAGRLAGIPGVMVHGRADMGGPPEFAWEMSRAWPDCDLKIVEDSGHLGSDIWVGHIREAISRFGGR